MNGESRISLGTGVAAAAALGLLLAGAGATYVVMRPAAATTPATTTLPVAPSASSGIPGAAGDVAVTLTPDEVQRAGLTTATVALGTSATELRLPGIVEPNAYRQVAVTPLVTGRVTRVAAQLGARVRKGETMAEIYSPAIAEARTKYVSVQAMLEAHDLELQRTQKLVEIGAASRQELERIHAEHAAQVAAVDSARSQLELLGVPIPPTQGTQGEHTVVSATSNVPAPIDGVITERTANAGLNVDEATRLFTVVDLSTVWIVADVFERDFSRVRVGSEVAITTPAYPGTTLRGRVSYIDPQVNTATRTAKVRIEVANPRGDLRLGMFADVAISTGEAAAKMMIPRASIQQIGNRSVVYVADPQQPGRFVERAVTLGAASGQQVEVVSGLQPGEIVVTEGSFFVRAERERGRT